MQTGHENSGFVAAAVLASVLLTAPRSGLAYGETPASQAVDGSRESRIVVVLGLDSSVELTTLEGAGAVQVGLRFANAAMLHGFRVEILDGNGETVRSAPAWEVAFSARGPLEARRTFARLNQFASALSLPRPLGYRLEAADSMWIEATWVDRAAWSGAELRFRVIVDLDPLDGVVSRLAVQPLREVGPQAAGDSTRESNAVELSWNWQAHVDGRMLALAGAPLGSAAELVLQDAATGEVLWRHTTDLQSRPGAHGSSVVRLGVVIHEGRTYRLTARYVEGAARETGVNGASVLAVALPGQIASR